MSSRWLDLCSGDAADDPVADLGHLCPGLIRVRGAGDEQRRLIEGGRDAQRRPRRLAALAMKDIADWIEPFRQQWASRFDNLDAHLATKKKQET